MIEERNVRQAWKRLFVLLAVMAFVVAACGGDGDDDTTETTAADAAATDAPDATTAAPGTTAAAATTAATSAEPVTIEWWHIQNQGEMLDVWQAMADEFMAANPHVTVNITVMENEAFKAALQTNLQAGDVPDLFQSWGGGGLREQVDAGLVQDITEASSGFVGDLNEAAVGLYQVDGVQYGIPFDLGMVGFWYNKDLFEEAGIDGPPATWDEFLEDVQTLKDAGIVPLAVGAGDKWPAHFYYSYLMTRIGGEAVMEQVAQDLDFTKPEIVEAGDQLQRLLDLEPFQPGYLASTWPGPDGEAGWVGTGRAAMSLMGQWGPGAYAIESGEGDDTMPPAERLPFELGWFPFPEVEGGAGAATDAFGGGNGFAVGRDAPPEAVQFLEYITSVDQAARTGETGAILPVTAGAEVSVTDPYQQLVVDGLGRASFVQLYLDQFFTPELGAAINDAVQLMFAGEATSEDVAQAITDAAS
jgi:raffinose/stachyose/melibiose transport system substrate-binding protein